MSQTGTGQQALFPPPPSFYNLYGSSANQPPPGPPIPVQGEYQVFGEIHTTEDGVPPLRVQQLYEVGPDGIIDFRGQLGKLNRELFFGYVELLRILIERPSAYARQVENLGLVLRNMLHLLNLMRAHQARATLEATIRLEIEEKKAAITELKESVQRSRAMLQSAAQSLVDLEAEQAEAANQELPPGAQ